MFVKIVQQLVTVTIAVAIIWLIYLGMQEPTSKASRTSFAKPIESDLVLVGEVDSARNPRIVVLDEIAGEYSLEWIGNDGGKKSILYIRPDTIEATVSAQIVPGHKKAFRYVYELNNLSDSHQYVGGLAIQTFASDVVATLDPEIYVGMMSELIEEFSEGFWYRFGKNIFGSKVLPGKSISVFLESDAPPTLVLSRVHGPSGLKGVGEEMPMALEDALLMYNAWPVGYTIGPSELHGSFTSPKKVTAFLDSLDVFVEIGWMIPQVTQDYRDLLGTNNIDWTVVARNVRDDFTNARVTSEIVSMLVEMPTSKI